MASENSPTQPAVWLCFQGYNRLILRGGGGGQGEATPPAGL
jgi:hypothetical protein